MAAARAPLAGLESRNGDDDGQTGKQAGPVEAVGRADTAAGRRRGEAETAALCRAAATRMPRRSGAVEARRLAFAAVRCGPGRCARPATGQERAAGGRRRSVVGCAARERPRTVVRAACTSSWRRRRCRRPWRPARPSSNDGGCGDEEAGPTVCSGPVAARGGVARRWAGAATAAGQLAPPSVGYSFKLN